MKKQPLKRTKISEHTVLYIIVLIAFVLMCTHRVVIEVLAANIEKNDAATAQVRRETLALQQSHCTGKQRVQQGATTTYTLSSGGYERTYHVHVPNAYKPSQKYPVIVNYDGIDGGGMKMESYSSVDELPVIAVYPDSLMGTTGFTAWQGAPYSLEGDYDVQFTKDMLEAVNQNYCTDPSKVFAIGMSNGGGFVVIADCKLPGVFQAIASSSGAYYTACDDTTTKRASLLALHSAIDPQVPYVGSATKGVPAVNEWAQQQAMQRVCKTSTHTSVYGSQHLEWKDCRDGGRVLLVVLQDQPHGWLSVPSAPGLGSPNTAEYIWSFFKSTI